MSFEMREEREARFDGVAGAEGESAKVEQGQASVCAGGMALHAREREGERVEGDEARSRRNGMMRKRAGVRGCV